MIYVFVSVFPRQKSPVRLRAHFFVSKENRPTLTGRTAQILTFLKP